MEWRMTLLSERAKGRIEGKEEGTLLAQIDLIVKKMRRGLELPAIAELLEVDEESIRPIYNAVKASAPDYDTDQLLERLRG